MQNSPRHVRASAVHRFMCSSFKVDAARTQGVVPSVRRHVRQECPLTAWSLLSEYCSTSARSLDAYLSRLSTTSARPSPADAAGTVYFSSSPTSVKDRFCSVPVQFGYELRSML